MVIVVVSWTLVWSVVVVMSAVRVVTSLQTLRELRCWLWHTSWHAAARACRVLFWSPQVHDAAACWFHSRAVREVEVLPVEVCSAEGCLESDVLLF